MAIDLIIKDPLGRKITLHARTWHGHILKGHPEIEHFQDLVVDAVQNPETIHISRADPECRLYYGHESGIGHRMMVVVSVVLGIVKTAHFARRISEGIIEWPS